MTDTTSTQPTGRYRYFWVGATRPIGLIRFDSTRITTAAYNRWEKEFVTHTDDDLFHAAFSTVMGWDNDGTEVTKEDAAKVIAGFPEVQVSEDEAIAIINKTEAE